MAADSYLRSLSSLSCGLLDGLCQAEDEDTLDEGVLHIEAADEESASEEESPERQLRFRPRRAVRPAPPPKRTVSVSRSDIEQF